MPDNNELFEDSSSDGGDTDDLIAESNLNSNSRLKKKKNNNNKKKKDDIPDADADDSDNDSEIPSKKKPSSSSSGDTTGLFDSDSENDDDDDDDDDHTNKRKLKKKSSSSSSSVKTLSKKERMEALRARKRQSQPSSTSFDDNIKHSKKKNKNNSNGYDSDNSIDSAQFKRTQEDDDFIDADDDDEGRKELYAEQHFDDEEAEEGMDEEEAARIRRKKGRSSSKGKSKKRGPDALTESDLKAEDNPLMEAVNKMKRKKKENKKLTELEDAAKRFLDEMADAADLDEDCIRQRRPATKKLAMLPRVLDELAKRDMWRPFLDNDLLMVAKRWIRPLPGGALGNVTVRMKLLEAIGNMNGKSGKKGETEEIGVTADDLKRSAFGKVVMGLYMHRKETVDMKRRHKALIEMWSRPIFKKVGNMREMDDSHFRERGMNGDGITSYAMARHQAAAAAAASSSSSSSTSGSSKNSPSAKKQDLTSILSQGSTSSQTGGANRVRVPYSKGFQFKYKPKARTGNVADMRVRVGNVRENRNALNRRMMEKTRPVSKNQRSANISVEGRPAK